MSRDKLVRNRFESFCRQAGRCFYCQVLMCIDDCASFAARHRISNGVARGLQCTAEHLQARRDGGTDQKGNIAAACRRCNLGRHRRKVATEPMQYSRLVRGRVLRGKWHDPQVRKAGLLQQPG